MKRILGFISFAIFIGSVAFAAEPVFKAKIDTNKTLIGKQIELKLSAEYDKNQTVFWPEIKDSVGSLEIVKSISPDTVQKEGRFAVNRQYTLTSFDSGSYQVPQFTFSYQNEGSEDLFAAKTKELSLEFASVTIDTTKDIKDIKPPLVPPKQFDWMILLYIALALLLLGAGYYVWKKYFASKPNAETKEPIKPKIPAHILAMESLKRLDEEKLWQNGQEKLYHIRLSEILRTYIASRFAIDAIEMTSSEILEHFTKSNDISDELLSNLRKQLDISDMTKFAKYKPLPDEHGFCLTSAIQFVEKTHRVLSVPSNHEEVK